MSEDRVHTCTFFAFTSPNKFFSGVNDTYDVYERPDMTYEESIFVLIAKSIDYNVIHNAIYSTLTS